MKTFFASLLGTLAALILFVIGAFVLTAAVLGVLATIAEKPVVVERGSYLVFDLAADISDAPPRFDGAALAALFSDEPRPQLLQLRSVTRALRAAARDERIAGVFLHGSFEPAGYGTGFAALREVRGALEEVRRSGKPVVAHLDFARTRDFYVATAASDLALDPYGLLAVPGLATQPTFFAGAFERFGVGVQVTRVGKYKDAVEPLIRRDLSPESREELSALLGDIWSELRGAIADSRGMPPQALQELVDAGDAFQPQDVLEHGLVDRLAYRDEIVAQLRRETGGGKARNLFKQVSLPAYIRQLDRNQAAAEESPPNPGDRRGQLAIVYAEGPIVDGEGRAGEVGGERLADELRRLRRDSRVKGIVLRVNSPGGSATASEQIQRELRLAREAKPVVVSMGTYAASGGYWISAYGDRIFAEPTTITGSIGVFGVLFNIEELGNELGLTWDTVKTGRFADLATITRPKTPEEMALVQRRTEWIYDEFVAKVAEGRSLGLDRVHEIAQGRVWSGEAARKIGLVDEIGGLADAVAHAAERAGLQPGFEVLEYPRHKDLAEMISEALERLQPETAKTAVVRHVMRRLAQPLDRFAEFNDPDGHYARLPFELIFN